MSLFYKMDKVNWFELKKMIKPIFFILLYFSLFFVQSSIIEYEIIDLRLLIVISCLLNIFIVYKLINVGFNSFKEPSFVNKIFSIFYSLLAYLSLMMQLGFIFFCYYISSKAYNIVPQEVAMNFLNNRTSYLEDIRTVLYTVFPIFYRYPVYPGIIVAFQFFIAKFIDLFMLANIVRKVSAM
ncbi:hypothetical protein [Enterococcus rivorum]|uniref:Uncharacterized protein n=2 Tax=Enterococcus rivorum TaxID=762845 RepID=A0A1E5KXL1_9ENTE|nr:hypothetical protein [Enterococcus rivorum]MBP2099500.1 hypothetical protein [Enterococcus rivorum]OEH82612.1 hypothetical protein BCR26_12785 [Enterococcus rivorum]